MGSRNLRTNRVGYWSILTRGARSRPCVTDIEAIKETAIVAQTIPNYSNSFVIEQVPVYETFISVVVAFSS
jgi:hypothetical protein